MPLGLLQNYDGKKLAGKALFNHHTIALMYGMVENQSRKTSGLQNTLFSHRFTTCSKSKLESTTAKILFAAVFFN